MFGLFKPRCPLATVDKAWVERRMCWLADQLGMDCLRKAVVLEPDSNFFPLPYVPTAEYAGVLMEKLARRMGIDPAALRFSLRPDEEMDEAQGLYQKQPRKRGVICIAARVLDDPPSLVATLAHELSHEMLLGRGRISPEEPDHEMVTDLLPVFLGMGIFAANVAVRQQSSSSGGWTIFEIQRQGYLPARYLGYGMALFAFARGEKQPRWSRHLTADARHALKTGLRYVHWSNDSAFAPAGSMLPRINVVADTLAGLESGSPSRRLITLQQLMDAETMDLTPELAHAISVLMSDSDEDVALVATQLVSLVPGGIPGAIDRLMEAVGRSSSDIRVAALLGIAALRADDRRVIPKLIDAMLDEEPKVIATAAMVLAWYGPAAAGATPYLLRALQRAMVACDDHQAHVMLQTLTQIDIDVAGELRKFFANDPAFLKQALRGLAQVAPQATKAAAEPS